jgi:hypothetical protein
LVVIQADTDAFAHSVDEADAYTYTNSLSYIISEADSNSDTNAFAYGQAFFKSVFFAEAFEHALIQSDAVLISLAHCELRERRYGDPCKYFLELAGREHARQPRL